MAMNGSTAILIILFAVSIGACALIWLDRCEWKAAAMEEIERARKAHEQHNDYVYMRRERLEDLAKLLDDARERVDRLY